MTFRLEEVEKFIQIFSESVTLIQSFEGCNGVQLKKDAGDERVYFTLSKWESEDGLSRYRSSELFKTTWSKVKPLFASKAEAWSLVDTLPV